jgi:hypothetical protein
MQDNELYNYFHERKHTGDEMPDDSLWAKIENGLGGSPVRAGVKSSIYKILLSVVTVVGITGGVYIYTATGGNDEKGSEEVIPAQEVLPSKLTTAEPFTPTEPADTVKRKKKVKPVAQSIPFKAFTDSLTKNRQIYKSFMPTGKDSILIANEPTTTLYGNTIKVTTGKLLSRSEFDTLVARTLKLHKDNTGKLLLIKAPGHKPYREAIIPSAIKLVDSPTVLRTDKVQFSVIQDSFDVKDSHPKPGDIVETYYADNKIYNGAQVTVQPEYPGGSKAFDTFVKNNVKIPDGLKKSAKVYLSYIIEKDGSISTVKIFGDAPGTVHEATNALKRAGKWTPAKLNGKPVRARYVLPLAGDRK